MVPSSLAPPASGSPIGVAVVNLSPFSALPRDVPTTGSDWPNKLGLSRRPDQLATRFNPSWRLDITEFVELVGNGTSSSDSSVFSNATFSAPSAPSIVADPAPTLSGP